MRKKTQNQTQLQPNKSDFKTSYCLQWQYAVDSSIGYLYYTIFPLEILNKSFNKDLVLECYYQFRQILEVNSRLDLFLKCGCALLEIVKCLFPISTPFLSVTMVYHNKEERKWRCCITSSKQIFGADTEGSLNQCCHYQNPANAKGSCVINGLVY